MYPLTLPQKPPLPQPCWRSLSSLLCLPSCSAVLSSVSQKRLLRGCFLFKLEFYFLPLFILWRVWCIYTSESTRGGQRTISTMWLPSSSLVTVVYWLGRLTSLLRLKFFFFNLPNCIFIHSERIFFSGNNKLTSTGKSGEGGVLGAFVSSPVSNS